MNCAVVYAASFALEVLDMETDLNAVLWRNKHERAISVGVTFDPSGKAASADACKLMSKLQWGKILEICPSAATLAAKVDLFKNDGGLHKV